MASYAFEVGGFPKARVVVRDHRVHVEVDTGDGWGETGAPNVIHRAMTEAIVILAHQVDAMKIRRRRRGGH